VTIIASRQGVVPRIEIVDKGIAIFIFKPVYTDSQPWHLSYYKGTAFLHRQKKISRISKARIQQPKIR